VIGVRVGVFCGVKVGVAGGVSANEIGGAPGLGILIIGDSQVGRGPVSDPTARADPAYSYGVTQSGTFVRLYRGIGQSVTNPLVHDVNATDVAVQPYTGTGAVVFSGPSTGMGQVLTAMGLNAVITEFAEVGLACKNMVDPAYPVSGGQYLVQLIAFQRAVEAAKGIQTRIILISAGNNDGFNAPDSAALPANMVTLYNTLIAAWPTAVFCWIKINADTINFPIRADTYTNQATGFTSLPLVKQIWCDDQIPALGIESDHAHLTPNGLRVYGTRALFQGLDALNYARTRPAAVPALVGDGYVFATDGTGAPTSDGAPIAFDEELLIKLDMLVGGAYVLNTTPAGWTSVASLVSNSGVGVGCRLTIYKRLVDEAMLAANHRNTAASSVALDVPCTRLFTKILTYRGSNAASAPTVAQTASAGVAGNTSSYAGPSLTTGGTNRRVVCITMGFISASLATTVTLTGLTSGTVDRNSVVITPGTAACLVDIQSAVVPTAATINITNVATSRTITSPVTFLVELAS